jgi:hypothetical protein
MSVEQLGYNAPDGMTMGRAATEAISFYGATPIVQPPDVTAASTFLVTTAVTTSCAGFTTAAQLSTFVAQVSSVVQALKNLGLVA